MDKKRINTEIYWACFDILDDSDHEIDGMDAGRMATIAQKAIETELEKLEDGHAYHIECTISGVKIGSADFLTDAIDVARSNYRFGAHSANAVYDSTNKVVAMAFGDGRKPWVKQA